MRCDNQNQTMKLNRFLARGYVIPMLLLLLDTALFFLLTYVINSVSHLGEFLHDPQHPQHYLGLENLLPHLGTASPLTQYLYGAAGIALLILDICLAYQIRTAFGETSVNTGQKGRERWTTVPEIIRQHKAIPLKSKPISGKPGILVSRYGKKLYIDQTLCNTLYIGSTRSGKSEGNVKPTIEINSRPKRIEDRPSMVIGDPKLDLYKSCKKMLEARGYIVRLFNLDDPLHSMGYNPLQLVIDHYKAGHPDKAQMAAKTFSFSIWQAAPDGQEPIWKNTATDLFTALIIAVATDCLEADEAYNRRRRDVYDRKMEYFLNLSEEEQKEAKAKFRKQKAVWLKLEEEERLEADLFMDNRVAYIPDTEPFVPVKKHEREINCFSCLNFFRELCDRAGGKNLAENNKQEFEQNAQTALDEYFNTREKLDFAAALYQEAKTAGARTKGSIYVNMQSAVSIFSLKNIAQLTAENSVDIRDLGYGDRPIAIFFGTPSEDKSNHFLATAFVAQVYQRLLQLTKAPDATGYLKRELHFILDEGGNLPRIENLGGFMTVCLGIGVRFDLYVQSYGQIKEKYKEEIDNILDNCGYQIYIKSIRNESAEEFSNNLGTKTNIEAQRSGTRFGLNKTYLETPGEEPLIFPAELKRLKEGECIVYRPMKRSDELGVAIEGFSIANEYGDPPRLLRKAVFCILTLMKRAVRTEPMMHPKEDRPLRYVEEVRVALNLDRRKRGTALLYAYQFLGDVLQNPKKITLQEVNTESREHIDITKRIYDPEQVLEQLKQKRGKKTAKQKTAIKDFQAYNRIDRLLADAVGSDYQTDLGLKGTTAPDTFLEIVESLPELAKQEKVRIGSWIKKEQRR